jgi:lipopolysaccharide transport system permease protein
MGRRLWQHRELICQLTRRQALQRYRGSYLGLLWSLITPLALLLVYTVAFSVILKVHWGRGQQAAGGHANYALMLLAGFVAFNFFSESVLGAPQSVVGNPNLVKRVVFPLETLPLQIVGVALVNSLLSLLVLLAGVLAVQGYIPWTIVFLPLIYVPLILMSAGFTWFFAALSVFLRDVGHLLAVAMQMLFFVTPIIYPASAVPESLRPVLWMNPLSFIVNHFRRVIILGQIPDWRRFGLDIALALMICAMGHAWFMKSRRAFADVV